ncbi:MAG: 4-hydroxy-3-methylbut-2-enyl diphosphate reductase [Flavobacteriales bacterium]
MKKFDIPDHYRSAIIGEIKNRRKTADPRKQDFTPAEFSLGPLTFILPRHFGFCYGVENAIERSYKAIRENPGKRLFLLSQMIHNPAVNEDLEGHGLKFIMDTEGRQLHPWEDIGPEDVVIIPAFGTTLETESLLASKGVEIATYNTTCPFVEKVWKRSAEIGQKGYSIIIHGKYKHEETRATFSHSDEHAPSIIVRDMREASLLGDYILGLIESEAVMEHFAGKMSEGFNLESDLERVGVVNQTTMLATETQEIADYFKGIMAEKYGDHFKDHFADTRDTLCYATNDNQQSTIEASRATADLALVIGGYNSSNTAQIVTILSERFPTYFIKDATEIKSRELIQHFDYAAQNLRETAGWLPEKQDLRIIITSGASCPDTVLEEVITTIAGWFPQALSTEEALASFMPPKA